MNEPIASPITRRTMLASLAGAALTAGGTRSLLAQPAAPTYWPTEDWLTAPPEEHGVDPAALQAVDDRAVGEVPAISALLAIRHGYLVFERYYGGQQAETPINVRSVTKSVTGTLAGTARRQGLLSGLDLTVGDLIPDRIPPDAELLVRDVTLWQWLTMTSGLDWDAATDWPRLIGSSNWVEMTLGLSLTGIPGQTYVYNTGGSHVLGVTVAAVAKTSLEAYAEEMLFRPLGIRPGSWQRSPQGEVNGGSGLELTPRDMAKLGFLYLHGGAWDGSSIITPEYAVAATTWQSAGDATGGWANYGYQWWITATNAGYPAYFALGYGGQHVFVVPPLDLVVVAAIDEPPPPGELKTPRFLIESIAAACMPD